LILTMYDARSLHNKQVVQEVQNVLEDKVLWPPIPRNIAVSEAASFGKPVIFYAPRAGASQAYLEIVKKFL
jgi:chromosome partitioning protein